MEEVKIKTEKCIGCGRCTEICPDSFALNQEGKAEVRNQKNIDCAKRAADECPQTAIVVNVDLGNMEI